MFACCEETLLEQVAVWTTENASWVNSAADIAETLGNYLTS